MQLTLDHFGRMVLPKTLREEFHLRAGSRLEVEGGGNCIILKPIEAEDAVREKEGLLVYAGTAEENLETAVARQRRQRIAALTGGTEGRR